MKVFAYCHIYNLVRDLQTAQNIITEVKEWSIVEGYTDTLMNIVSTQQSLDKCIGSLQRESGVLKIDSHQELK